MAVLLAAGECFSAGITTLNGKTHKDARVTGIEPDGVHITFQQGVVKVPFDELPEEIQRSTGQAGSSQALCAIWYGYIT